MFFPLCLPSNGGSPWYPSNQLEHQATALCAVSTTGAAAHLEELGLLLAFQTL